MLTYQIRERVYRHAEGQECVFPNEVEVVFYLQPLQPFGKEAGGGRTAVRSVAATTFFDANSGHHTIASSCPLEPVDLVIEEPSRVIRVTGNELHIVMQCEDLAELNRLVESVYFGMPMLLNVEFADPPVVERVDGRIGSAPFRWELKDWRMGVSTTTQELQEQRLAASWRRFDLLSQPGNRRLIAALHYFHMACRLSRAGNSPWEFMSEVILDLNKVIEVLFPSESGQGGTVDAARRGLAGLGYSEEEIEALFVPVMYLRNHIDSGHVDLSIFTMTHLRVLHSYSESAETAFREMLQRLLEALEGGDYSLPPYTTLSARKEAVSTIENIVKWHRRLRASRGE